MSLATFIISVIFGFVFVFRLLHFSKGPKFSISLATIPSLQTNPFSYFRRKVAESNPEQRCVDRQSRADKASPQPGSVLVIVNGQLRGGPIAWRSLEQYVLNYYNADLALIGPPLMKHETAVKKLVHRAKYVWVVEEYDDWGVVLDSIADNDTAWRALCKLDPTTKLAPVKIQFLGGVKDCHAGSAGILLAYRYLTAQKLIEYGLLDSYEWFIYTRSDYVYLCHPPPLQSFSPFYVHMPHEEGYGGITDRHTYIPQHEILQVLNVSVDLVRNWKVWYEYNEMNLEMLLKRYFDRTGICYRNFAHTAFTVRRQDDPTRWEKGHANKLVDKYNVTVKYDGELREATSSCDPWNKFNEVHENPEYYNM